MAQQLERVGHVPAPLAQMGVQVGTDEHGYRMVAIPRELRQQVNVLLPVQEIAQADPNFSPSVRMVELNVEQHSYDGPGGKKALNKQGLEILAMTAGVLRTRTRRIPASELQEGEIGYEAEIHIRRSDGSIEAIKRDKIVVIEVEQFKVGEEVQRWAAKYRKSREEAEAEYRKRWIKERGDMYAKCESKAVLRALRAALHVQHGYSPAEFNRPWLVVGWSFTPDTSDPEVKRMLMAHGLQQTDRVYGVDREDTESRAELDRLVLPPANEADDPDENEPVEPEQPQPKQPEAPPPDQPVPAPQTPQKQPGPEPTPPAPDPPKNALPGAEGDTGGRMFNPDDAIPFGDPDAEFTGAEPPPPAEPVEPGAVRMTAQVASAGAVPIGFGRMRGKTIADVAAEEPGYLEFLASKQVVNATVRDAARVYMEAMA
jgi:hypothetical protein